tara:strand:+ start:164 stop:445 length:282 start_codon:yes stop_codon:yes gene_type:complete
MNEPFDERVKMPKFLRNIIVFTFGISGLALMFRGSYEADYTDSLVFLSGGVFSSFAVWGFICILDDIKKSKSLKELRRRLLNKFEKYNDDRYR